MNSPAPVVGVVMGSRSDWETMSAAAEVLRQFDVPFECRVVSAHRTPVWMSEYAAEAEGRGLKIIIAGAGGAAHLPGMIAAQTVLPVLGVPVQSKALNGLDSLLSIVQMPGGIPVGTLAIGISGARNAGLLAVRILAVSDASLTSATAPVPSTADSGSPAGFRINITLKSWGHLTVPANAVGHFDARFLIVHVSKNLLPEMSKSPRILVPGSTLGMLGGGQLGRMFALSARQNGYRVVIFGDPRDSPAGQISDQSIAAGFRDEAALLKFARAVDVVTYEQENIPVPTVEFLTQHVDVYPGAELLRASQHRLLEKSTLRKIGIPTADFAGVHSVAELETAVRKFGGDAILKTVTLGYDGKGQARVRTGDDLEAVWKQLNVTEAIVEKVVDFSFELSIVASRFGDGTCAFYSPVRNDHVNHILDLSISPAPEISQQTTLEATRIARAILEHFQVIGVLCVELFATTAGTLVVNEIAPRPHNSGHLTIDACRSSQFEQQMRAVCGLPSGDVQAQTPAAMANLLGDHIMHATPEKWRSVFELANVHVHMYGKAESRVGRKMGHLTATAATSRDAADLALEARRRLG